MELTRQLLQSAAKALDELLKFQGPADGTLQIFFKKNQSLGARDRKIIAELVFCVLRHLESLQHCCNSKASGDLLLAALALYTPVPYKADDFSMPQYQANATGRDLPSWLETALSDLLTGEGLTAFANTVNSPAPLDLRINSMVIKRQDVLKQLTDAGLQPQETAYSPFGLRLIDKRSLNQNHLFQNGLLEIQDEGSQLLSMLPEVRRNDLVVDFCAGAGGKTLFMGMQMRNKSRIYALDIDEKRLSQLSPRAQRAGLDNIFPMRIKDEHDPALGRLAGKIDKVLVDAPCSGIGTIRRNPDLKWRRQPGDIAAISATQYSILEAAGRLCKIGGRLVYATCSVLPEEDEAVVEKFLTAHPDFSLQPAAAALNRQGVNISFKNNYLRLWPHEHGTDGFFGAVLVKNG